MLTTTWDGSIIQYGQRWRMIFTFSYTKTCYGIIGYTFEARTTNHLLSHYSDVYSTVQRKHQSSASLASVRGIHQWPLNSSHKWPLTRKMFPFDDVIMQKVLHFPEFVLIISLWFSKCIGINLHRNGICAKQLIVVIQEMIIAYLTKFNHIEVCWCITSIQVVQAFWKLHTARRHDIATHRNDWSQKKGTYREFKTLDLSEAIPFNIPNCMKEVTWLKLCLSTNGHRSAALWRLSFILPPVFVQAAVIRSW